MIFYYYCEGNACAMCIVKRSENNSVGCSSPYPFTWSWGLDSVLSGSTCVCSLTSSVSPPFFCSALRTTDTSRCYPLKASPSLTVLCSQSLI